MPRLAPVNYKKLVKVFEKLGFVCDRQEGDHVIYIKNGCKRPIVIPMYDEVPVFLIMNNLRSASITRSEYFKLLN